MNYVFCGGYAEIYLALHLRNEGKRVAILTNHESIIRFCTYANFRYVELDHDDSRYYRLRLSDARRLLAKRRSLDRLLGRLDIQTDDVLVFSGGTVSYSCLYIAKQWAKKGKVCIASRTNQYAPLSTFEQVPDKTPSSYRVGKTTLGMVKQTRRLLRLTLGLKLTIYDFSNFRLQLGIDDTFLAQNNINSLDVEPLDQLVLEAVEQNSVHVGAYDNLLASGYPAILTNLQGDSLERLYHEVFRIVPDIAVKCHPVATNYERYQRDNERFFERQDLLPSHIPVELLLTNVKKNVLSVSSLTLAFSSKMKHLRSISLMDLVEYKPHREIIKTISKENLKEMSGNKIIFVQTFDELKSLFRS